MVGSVPGYHPPITEAGHSFESSPRADAFFFVCSHFDASCLLTLQPCAAGGICNVFVLITKVVGTLETHMKMK